MKLYILIDGNGYITGSTRERILKEQIEVELNDESETLNYKYVDGELVKLSEDEKINVFGDPRKAEQESLLQSMMLNSARTSFLVELPDAQAATIPLCYDPWMTDKLYKVGDRCECDGKLWKCRTEHTSQENWKPSINTASIWEVIDVEHAGTLEDPIPYDQTMTVYNGKYYSENGIIYKCIRDSGQPLYASCSALVGNYFEVAQ